RPGIRGDTRAHELRRPVGRRDLVQPDLRGPPPATRRALRQEGGATHMNGWYDANLILVQNTFIGLVLALSIQFPMRMGVFSFTGAGSYGLGAYLAAILVIDHRFPALAAIAAAMAVSLVVSVLLGLLVQQLDGLYLGTAPIAFCLTVSVAPAPVAELTWRPAGP